MFSDPQVVTVNAVAQSMPAIARTSDNSVYQRDDGSYKLTISHKYMPERKRFSVRIDANKIAADPLVASNNRIYSGSCYFVLDFPNVGYTNTEIKDIMLGLTGWATSARILQVAGGET